MGNIVKFDLTKTPNLHPKLFVKPEDQLFWESVKQDFLKKYGSGSHNVTMKIVQEIGVSQRIKELVDCVGFEQAADNAATADLAKKFALIAICGLSPLAWHRWRAEWRIYACAIKTIRKARQTGTYLKRLCKTLSGRFLSIAASNLKILLRDRWSKEWRN